MQDSKKNAGPLACFSVFLVASSAAAATIFLSSDLTPLGRNIYELFAKVDENPAGGGLHPYQVALIVFILMVFQGYLLDMHLWRKTFCIQLLVKLYLCVLGLFLFAGVALYTTEAPSIPPILGIGLGVVAVWQLRVCNFQHVSAEEFSLAAAVAYGLVGVQSVVLWMIWAFSPWMGYHTWDWNEAARPGMDTQNFVRWCSPVVVGLVHGLIALFLRLRSHMHMSDEFVLAELKLICSVFVLMVLFTWLSASVAAGDSGLSKAVLRLSVLLSVGAAGYLMAALGPAKIFAACERSEALSLVMPLLMGDWAKGAFLLICLPLIPVCVVVEMFHMIVRRLVQKFLMTHWDRSKYSWITDEAAYAVELIWRWDAGPVMTKCMWLGFAYFLVQVGCARGVVVLLAWICERSADYSLPAILFVLYGVGIVLFLLPPVPGCPIYMVSAILVTQRFEASGRPFLFASLIALALSTLIKLSAVAMQQKFIGEPFSNSVRVKRMVGVHTREMKAIRHILSQPGLHTPKVIVLVFGPDWPTSVFTGILKLPVLQMLLGSLPVCLLIVPFTLCGSFVVHASHLPDGIDKRRLEGLGTALLVLAMLCQMAGMVAIAQVTQATLEKVGDELENGGLMKDEKEDAILEQIKQDEARTKLRQELTKWSVLPWWACFVLLLGVTLMSLMMHIILLPFLKPFKDFSLTDKVSQLEGVYFLVNKPGWVAIAFLCGAMVCLTVFEVWYAWVMRTAEKRPLLSGGQPLESSYSGAGTAAA